MRKDLTDEIETERPPPIDFSKLSDSEKLGHLCNVIVDIADGLVAVNQNLQVLNSRIGIAEEDGLTIQARLKRFETALVENSKDAELIRKHLFGNGAKTRDLQLVELIGASSSASDR